ncbi:radical SAM family heme chaperone HemW [Leptolyngbya sp. 7M]|uniref:radical SAM family heme chaperone HemW n=1 Tax=Leptolyngbya sp. 7M TaxID=2812896 RepID=UPI001B8D232C|nr:radical SAM family heme chaperone HemW [Leptolyngbya sp. 7M]QYO67680.1 radical SAM family heme chaperone HemW [Leptolyngbya sp. 7M]
MTAGVYLHIPFCKSRCSYCDFATDVYRDSGAVERYVDALCREMRSEPPALVGGQFIDASAGSANCPASDTVGSEIDTIYFGGGTPSLLEPAQIEKIINSVFSVFFAANEAEITMEMNPATVTPEKLAAFRKLGINRASFGVQTFNDRDLKLLARGHDAKDVKQTYRMLREACFDNISFDLIAGLPGQTMEDWKRNLDEAISMEPEHLSLYLLEIHESTPLAEQVRSGRRTPIDEELAAEMYETMLDRLAVAGYEQYEISNFAKPGFESRHNTKYWTMQPVYGFGVSAHSFDGYERYANERDTARYVEMIETTGSAETYREQIDIASETAFLGLRMNRGIDIIEYKRKFGVDLTEKTASLAEKGLIQQFSGRSRLTRKGILYSNEVFAEFV